MIYLLVRNKERWIWTSACCSLLLRTGTRLVTRDTRNLVHALLGGNTLRDLPYCPRPNQPLGGGVGGQVHVCNLL